VQLAPEHLSLYALTVEEGTGLAALIAHGRRPEPDPDLQAAMYELTQDLMAAAGYEHYEISNWARPGRACRHNLVYWRDGDWLGLGPGAHSHLGGRRFAVVRSPGSYIRKTLLAPATGASLPERMPQVESVEEPDPATERADAAILALRLAEGLDAETFTRRFGVTVAAAFPGVVEECTALGLVEQREGQIRLTRSGRLLSNEVFVRLLAAARETAVP
jgi:oxygen-independent coproporphyrinogen III oxidase